MECDAENGIIRNDVLSQSYAECVERVAQQKNDSGLTFNLPKEVLEEREKVWDNFFDKYADEASDDVDLDMNTMKPVAAADEEDEDDDDEEEEDEEDEEKEYYSKCRAPLRKLPALIQYWIDTGNPPYQLVGDDDNSETGSSLSEGEHSRSGHSAVLRASSDKHKSNTSRCSSVDTAAYILSNTNTTRKSETMAIVEGAKISDEHFTSKASPLKEVSAKSADSTKKASFTSPNRGRMSPAKISQPATAKASRISSEFEKTSTTTPLKSPHAKHSIGSVSKPFDVSTSSHQSVKLSEILPELQEFDEMLKKSNTMSVPGTSSPHAEFSEKPKSPEIADTKASQSSENTSIFPSGQNRLQNRRKLYTGRDSPVDLAPEKTKDTVVQHSVRRSLHPALETPSTRTDKAARLAARVRRRKRKRASQISEMNSQDGNTSQESDQPIGQENSKSDSRYTNFFESLGLTPSKTVIDKLRARKPPLKRSRKIERQILPRQAKNVEPINDSIESSLKESSQTEGSDFSPIKKAGDLGERKTTDGCFGPEEKERILGDKILSIRIETLSDDFLARYKRVEGLENTVSKKLERNELQAFTTSSNSSSSKKEGRSKLEKIELLTTMTHDSDSSTILICSCNDTVEQCDSNGKLLSKNVTQTKKRTLRKRGSKSPTKAVNDAPKTEFTKNSDKLPVVQLEKMRIDNLQVNTSKNETLDESVARKDFKTRFQTSLNPLSQRARGPLRNGNKIDLFGSKAADDTIVSRIFGKANNSETAEKSRPKFVATRARCNLGISIPSDEEEDSFVKLISEIGSKRDSTKLEEINHEKETKMNSSQTQNLSNEDRRIPSVKPRKLFAISMSSDEEDVYVHESKRRTRNSDSRNNKKRAERRQIKDNLLKEGEEVAKLNNHLDESNRRKMTSENAVQHEVESEVQIGKTRGSSERRKMEINTLSSSEVEEEVKIGDESQVIKGRRKTTKNAFSTSKDEMAMEVENNEAQQSNDVRRSSRHKLPASSLPKNQIPVKNSIAKPKDTKTFLATSKASGLKDAVVLMAWDDPDLGLKKKNLGAGSVLEITGQTEKSKNRETHRVARDEKKIVRSSVRFQTRLDSDSDAEFEGLRFSLNDKYIQQSPTESTNQVTSFNENEPGIEATEILRTSPRRSFKSSSEKKRENGENKFKKRGRNLFNDGANSTEKSVDPFKNEVMAIEAFWNNESVLLNEFPIKGMKGSNEKQRKTTSKEQSQVKHKSRRDSTKFDQSKNQSLRANQRNGGSRNSPLAKKKKTRRPKILGNPMDWESDDNTDSNDNKISSNNGSQDKGLAPLTNGYRSTQLSNEDAIDDRKSSRKQQSTSLFPTSPDGNAEDVDLLFSGAGKSRGAKNVVLIPKLNFATFTKHKKLSSIGMSSIRFRTRLRSDSEDDGEL